MNEIEELRLGLETAYIDGNVASNLMYKPQFVSNNYKEGKKVIDKQTHNDLSLDNAMRQMMVR